MSQHTTPLARPTLRTLALGLLTGALALSLSPTLARAETAPQELQGASLAAQPGESAATALRGQAAEPTLTGTPDDDSPEGSPAPSPAAGGWREEDGAWHSYRDGEAAEGWLELDDAWYYLDPTRDGERASGWVDVDGTWYYLDPTQDGARKQGWGLVDGTWYFFDPESGAMVTGAFTDEGTAYVARCDGACLRDEWVFADGSWYLTGPGLAVRTGWACVDGAWYLLGEDGRMLTGWADPAGSGSWYWLDPATGAMATGWLFADGTWYYLLPSGEMARGAFLDADGHWGVTDASGAWRHVSDWPALDDQVIPLAASLGLDLKACYDRVSTAYGYRSLAHWPSYEHWQEDYALNMMASGSGNCYSYATLFAFLARACGLDAQPVQGSVRYPRTGQLADHCWVEANVGGRTYVYDPELQHEYPTRDCFAQDAENPIVTYVKP